MPRASRRSPTTSITTRSRRCTSTSAISSARDTSSGRTTKAARSRSFRASWSRRRSSFPSFVQRGGNHYVLRVRGNSMIEEHIRDGDFVIVNERQRADNGEMVIAMLHGNSATVKKFYRERDGRIRLQPANETMAPMYVHENDITIQGIVVGVMRRY